MKHRLLSALAAGSLLATCVGFAAHSADEDFCRGYAQAAVHEVEHAMDQHRCRDMMQGARWSTDWRVHFGWCRHVSRDAARAENDARRDALMSCSHHDDWDHHDHDHDHDHD